MDSIGFMKIRRDPAVSAVSVLHAYKNYSKKPGSKPIINNLSMNVQSGKIYSLLGSSGCGKTTLLSCVIGMRKLDAGDITVFGKTPGSAESGVPGRRLGFMPQEIALHGEFSISEELHYFGRIYGMSSQDVEENKKFLINFLKLPPADRRINSLSGGQQRRVSFAAALVHNPELLILDEPTVGVDPLLRRSIWSHLVKLASSSGTSIIITTHFIEEARDSNRIGLMRNGRILMEETPLALMKKYQTNILEEIVVELCLKDKSEEDTERDDEPSGEIVKGTQTIQTSKSSELLEPSDKLNTRALVLSASALVPIQKTSNTDQPVCEPLVVPPFNRWPSLGQVLHKAKQFPPSATVGTRKEKYQKGATEKFERISALLIKNVLALARNLLFVFFLLGQPALQIVLVCLAVGPDPHGIILGVVNKEVGYGEKCDSSGDVGCIVSSAAKYNTKASCEYIKTLDSKIFGLVEYKTEFDAIKDVKLGKLTGVMAFPMNFTEYLKERLQYGAFASLEVLLASRIEFNLDMSNKQVALLIQKNILESYQSFMKNTAVGCKFDTEGVDLPVYFGRPVFGSLKTSFTEFIAPGCIIAILFFFPICSTAMAMIMEKASGTLERTLVAGVKSQEIMISHFITQTGLLIVQVLFSFLIVFLFFKIEIIGSVILSFTLATMVGVSGISFGFFVAAICRTELESVLMTISAFMPNLVLSGVIWPLEASPGYLQIVSYFLPCTIPCASIRSIIGRGSTLLHPDVWPGFVSITFWIAVYWMAALFINMRKNKH